MFASIRYAYLIRCGLCENSVEFVVQAGHCCGHSSTGRTAASHGHHRQHLGLLRFLHSLQGILPVLGAYRHVSRLKCDLEVISQETAVNICFFHTHFFEGLRLLLSTQFPNSLIAHQGAVCLGVWDQHLFRHHPEEHHHPDICWQARPGVGCSLSGKKHVTSVCEPILGSELAFLASYGDPQGIWLLSSVTLVTKHTGHPPQNPTEIWYWQVVLLFLSSWCTSSTSRFSPSCTLWAPPSSSSVTTDTGPGKKAWPRDSLSNCVRPVQTQRQRSCPQAPKRDEEEGSLNVWMRRVLWLDPWPQSERFLCSGWRRLLSQLHQSAS